MADDTEWTPKQDMSLLCRVCANQHDYLIPIFQGEGLDHDMPTKMDKHLPIKVRESDKLPTQMCYQCASTIIAWSELHTNCLAADKKLKGMLRINEKKMGVVDTADDDVGSDHYEDAYDDGGGGGDDDDEDFEKEIKQLISDAGVELGSKTAKASKRPSRAAATRKRKSEVTITPVKRETKKPKTEPSASKSSTALLKPKEEVVSNEDRFTCHQCLGTRASGCICVTLIYKCELCSVGFESNNQLMEHMSSCESEPVHPCPVCKVLTSKDSLKSHLTCHGADDMSVSCEDRLRRLKNRRSLKSKNQCKPKNKKTKLQSHECKLCEKKFCKQYELEKHYKNCHKGETPFVCEICGKAYATPGKLRAHKHLYHPPEKPHMCNYCGRKFLVPSLLKLHERIHTGEKPCVCELCGKSFAHPTGLLIHKKLTHRQGELRFKCEYCDQAFHRRRSYNLHLQNHTNTRPYECEICHKGFKVQYDLKSHEKFVHTDVRDFKCHLCTADFKNQKHLRRHCNTVHKYSTA